MRSAPAHRLFCAPLAVLALTTLLGTLAAGCQEPAPRAWGPGVDAGLPAGEDAGPLPSLDGALPPMPDASTPDASMGPATRPLLGARRSVYRLDNAQITQALDMVVHDGAVVACFGSWGSTAGWDSRCRNLSTGEEQHGNSAHETAGVGLALGPSGPLIAFEADMGRSRGGPATFAGGVVHNDGAHFWQSVSVGGGFAVAAAARISGFNSDIFIGEAEGEGAWSILESRGLGVPHRQTFVAPYHLLFTTRYRSSGTPRMIRVDTGRNVTEVSYTGLPGGCEGVATAEMVEGVGLVAGTYSDQLPWRGGDCAHVGLLDHETGATSSWRHLGGADVVDILDLGGGYFALSAALPPRVYLFSPELEPLQEIALPYSQAGGLAYLDGELYAASAERGRAEVFAFPVSEVPIDPGTEPPPTGSAMAMNLVIRQTEQACSSCGIWFDPQGDPSKRPRLRVRYRVAGAEQTMNFQRGGDRDLFAYYISNTADSRADREDSLLVKQALARVGLLYVDLSAIPEGAEILEARLYLHIHDREGLANSDMSSVLTVYEGVREWDFATVTWSEWAAGQPWSSPGGDVGPMVREIRADRDLWGRGFNKANPDANFDFTEHVIALQARRGSGG